MLVAGVVDVVELHIAGGARATRPLQPALPELFALFAPDAPGVERTLTGDGDVLLRVEISMCETRRLGEVA